MEAGFAARMISITSCQVRASTMRLLNATLAAKEADIFKIPPRFGGVPGSGAMPRRRFSVSHTFTQLKRVKQVEFFWPQFLRLSFHPMLSAFSLPLTSLKETFRPPIWKAEIVSACQTERLNFFFGCAARP
jgi:hypothetical protein